MSVSVILEGEVEGVLALEEEAVEDVLGARIRWEWMFDGCRGELGGVLGRGWCV